MKRFKKLLTCASVFALTACSGGLGKKVSNERALEIAANLSNNYVRLASETRVEYKEYFPSEDYRNSCIATVRENLNGDIYCSYQETENNITTEHYEVYIVANELYDEVFYVRDYVNEKMGEAPIKVMTKRDNDNYYSKTRPYFDRDDNIVYHDVKETDCLEWAQYYIDNTKIDSRCELNLYSKGKNDLSIQIIVNGTTIVGSDRVDSRWEQVTTFGKNGLVSFVDSAEYSDGDSVTYSQKTKYAYGFDIALPNGWQQYLNK